MSARLSLGLIVASALVATAARGDAKAACLEAASKAQNLQGDHKLLEAQEQLRVCAAAECPRVVQSDCAGWLADVERALPSVVITAKNGAGADLVNVMVSVDGRPFTANLDGRAVPIDAGVHEVHFEGPDGATLDRRVVVREGEKNQEIAIVLAAPPSAPRSPANRATAPASSGSSGAWKTAGWIIGGAGVIGLGMAATFGVIALEDKNAAHCNAEDVCDPGTTSGIRHAALASDVSLIAGGVLLASGAAIVLFAPSGHRPPSAGLRLAPTLTAGGGGLVAGGSW